MTTEISTDPAGEWIGRPAVSGNGTLNSGILADRYIGPQDNLEDDWEASVREPSVIDTINDQLRAVNDGGHTEYPPENDPTANPFPRSRSFHAPSPLRRPYYLDHIEDDPDTERRRINKDVHDGSQEYLQRPAATFTWQTSPRPCVLINHQYEVVFANQAAADVFEVSVNDLIGYELKSPTSHSAGSDQLAVSQPNAKGFIAELQAWWEGAQCLHNGGSELLRDTASKKCFAWTCTSFEDERGKRLTQFVGLGRTIAFWNRSSLHSDGSVPRKFEIIFASSIAIAIH